MRIAILADSHFDETSRFDETVRIHEWIADDIASRDVDLVLHAGDIYERKSSPRERLAVADWVRRVTATAPLVIVRGNHDAPRDIEILAQIETDRAVFVEEAAAVLWVGAAAIACVAWPRKAELLARLPGAVGSEQAGALAADALRDLLRGLGDQLEQHAGPRLLLMHAMVRGSRTSTGQPLVGCDMEIGTEDLGLARADVVCLGHIHCGQDWEADGQPIIYPGSPRRTAFGESEAKGYVLIEIADERPTRGDIPVRWERVETPATPMVHIEAEWLREVPGVPTEATRLPGLVVRGQYGSSLCGAEVRLRYEVPSDAREAAAAEARAWREGLLADGAVSVKVEEVVIAEARSRTPEITTATTLPDKLRTLWAARGITLTPTREERVIARLADVEAA